MRLCQWTLSHLLYWALRGINWHPATNDWPFCGQIVCMAAGMWYWAMRQMALTGHKWLLSNKYDFSMRYDKRSIFFFYEWGPCLNDLLAASKLYHSDGSLALPSICFRSWSKSKVQNTTCYSDCHTCSTDKSCIACPWACRLSSKAWMTVPERWLLFLKHSCYFFIILNQKYGVFCFTCWQPQVAPSTRLYEYNFISHPKPEEICDRH